LQKSNPLKNGTKKGEGMSDKICEFVHIPFCGGTAFGMAIDLGEASILIIRSADAFLMCGILDVPILDKALPGKIKAVKIFGARTFDDLLNNRIVLATEKAKEAGVTEGMTGREALETMTRKASSSD
jgi:uncharacterized protein YunC (DUF1805 family)